MVENYFLSLINNSSNYSKEIMVVVVLGYVTLISRVFYNFISSFST